MLTRDDRDDITVGGFRNCQFEMNGRVMDLKVLFESCRIARAGRSHSAKDAYHRPHMGGK